jgi:hypothetical protein
MKLCSERWENGRDEGELFNVNKGAVANSCRMALRYTYMFIDISKIYVYVYVCCECIICSSTPGMIRLKQNESL